MARRPESTVHDVHSLEIEAVRTFPDSGGKNTPGFDAGRLMFDREGERCEVDLYANLGTLTDILTRACQAFLESTKREG